MFDSAVRRGESPWELIRADQIPDEDAARNGAPRALVGSRPVGGDFVRRFVQTAAENGIEVFRLYFDPSSTTS